MTTFVQLTTDGLANGAILALAALGFVLIFKATGVVNFAQGELLLIGAYMVYTAVATYGLHWTLGVALAVVIAAALGVLIERLVLRPLVGQNTISVIMVTVGLAGVLRGTVQLIWGTVPRELPPFIPGGSVTVAGISIPANRLWAIALAAAALIAFGLFFQRSRRGVAMRAVADDQQTALLMGISVRRVFALAWALAAVSAVIGGVLLANITGVSGDVADFGLVVFPVVIIGGLESIPGVVVGGAVIGLLNAYASGYLSGQVLGLELQGLQEVVPFVVLVLILLSKPYGLFGQPEIERV